MRLKVHIQIPPVEDIEAYVNDMLENFILEDDGELTPEGLEALRDIAYDIMTDNMEIEITQEVD